MTDETPGQRCVREIKDHQFESCEHPRTPYTVICAACAIASIDALVKRERAAWVKATAPFVRFIEQWDRRPISQIANEFYAIHTGTEWEASLRLSDFRRLRARAAEEGTS